MKVPQLLWLRHGVLQRPSPILTKYLFKMQNTEKNAGQRTALVSAIHQFEIEPTEVADTLECLYRAAIVGDVADSWDGNERSFHYENMRKMKKLFLSTLQTVEK